MRPRGLDGYFLIAGRRVPVVIGAIIGLTLVASILGALTRQAGIPLTLAGALIPDLVWHGQLWRLVTWVFFETDPISLLFAGLVIWWFGNDLVYYWGPRRFLATYLGCAAVTGALTTVLGGLVPGLGVAAYVGSWPVADAIIIAWALSFPGRQMLLYFILPIGGTALIYATVGLTVLFAIFGGVAAFIPHFIAEGLILAHLRGMPIRRLWLRYRLSHLERSLGRRSHLRPVERDDPPGGWLH